MYQSRQYTNYVSNAQPKYTYDHITIGTIIDTNDPMQWGRVRVICPVLGESPASPVSDVPWAIQISPFAGSVSNQKIGPNQVQQAGTRSFGLWTVPKVGNHVAVFFIDGNPRTRAYFGGVFEPLKTHTMPHGRWIVNDNPSVEKNSNAMQPYGPLTSEETLIKTLGDNASRQFTQGTEGFEWRSRMADYSVSAVNPGYLNSTTSSIPDDINSALDGHEYTQGYGSNKILENGPDPNGVGYNDNQVYALVSPGFHAMSMDDRPENCRIRLRTACGNQIIMDDTNERIYVSTATGNNWIEMDQCGNIDIFSSRTVSIHSEGDMNLTSDKAIKLYAKEDIHFKSDNEIRMQSKKDMSFKSETIIKAKANKMSIDLTDVFNIKSSNAISLTSNIINNSCSNLLLTGSSIDLSSSVTKITGSVIHLDGSVRGPKPSGSPDSASSASEATVETVDDSYYVSRIPQHEPWGRSMTKKNDTIDPELNYSDPNVGKIENGSIIPRNPKWRR